jgi:hypothetical protein
LLDLVLQKGLQKLRAVGGRSWGCTGEGGGAPAPSHCTGGGRGRPRDSLRSSLRTAGTAFPLKPVLIDQKQPQGLCRLTACGNPALPVTASWLARSSGYRHRPRLAVR